MGRRIAIWLFFAGAMLLVITRFASLRDLGASFSRARVGWLVAAAAVHGGYLVLYAELYRRAFAAVGVRGRLLHLLPVYLASTVANALAPSGGAAAAAVFAADANRRGQPGARAVVGTIVVLAADLASLAPFLAWTLWVLRGRNDLRSWLALGIGAFLGLVTLVLVALALGRRHGAALARPLEWVERAANWALAKLRRRPVRPDWAAHTAEQLALASAAAASRPSTAAAMFGLGTALHVVNAVTLAALFVAFGLPVWPGPLVAGFAMGIVFYVVGIVPQGLAVVEGVMVFVFTSLGFDASRVAAAVVAFRALNVVLPVLLGLAFARRLALPVPGAGTQEV